MIHLETVDAPDPEAPNRTIRRQRRVDPLRYIGRAGDPKNPPLEEREWAAAERLRQDNDLSMGYREDDRPLGERVDTFSRGDGYTAEMLDALRRMAWLSSGVVMPRPQWDVVKLVVIDWDTLRQAAEELRIRQSSVAERLRSGLAALVEFYG